MLANENCSYIVVIIYSARQLIKQVVDIRNWDNG